MMRNDYRRALILMRSNAAQCSGHARLERRTLTANMYFQLQLPAEYGQMHAALAGQDKNGSFACDLGEIRRDSRGQATLSCNFDPRNICGRELEKYRLVVIAAMDAGGCSILMHGNIAGHADVNWEGIRRAVCALYSDEPAGETGLLPQAQDLPDMRHEEIEIKALPETAEEPPCTDAEMPQAHEAPQEETQTSDAQPDEDAPLTAGQILNINPDLPWPESIEPLRPLFMLSVPLDHAPDDEYVYIAAAMPEDSGYSHCAVGIIARDGMPVSVRYALPAAWTAQPPAGLEEYSWVGDYNRGWWITQLEPCN